MLALLSIAKEQAFKIWYLSGVLKIIAAILGLSVLSLAVYAVVKWHSFSLITVGELAWTIGSMIAALFISKIIINTVRFKETVVRFIVILAFDNIRMAGGKSAFMGI